MLEKIRTVTHIDPEIYERGDFCLVDGGSILICPRCKEIGFLSNTVVYNGEGKVTLNPSVGCPICRANFFVVNDVIKWLSDY